MATLREWFNQAGADWGSLTLIVHNVTEDSYSPGWGTAKDAFRLDSTQLAQPHPVLDEPFNAGYGAPRAPRFIGYDKTRIYFPSQYDGATGIEVVLRDVEQYMDIANETPYPGG